MLYRSDNVHAALMISCDDVIDDTIMEILALKFCIFIHKIGKIGQICRK